MIWLLTILVFFSPNGGCEDAIVKEIDKAHFSIRVQAYYLTNAKITTALIGAKQRGADVQVILDGNSGFGNTSQFLVHETREQQGSDHNSPQASRLTQAEIPVFIDQKHAIAHNKVIVIDLKTTITGSYNFTESAEHSNAENIVIIKDNNHVATEYWANWMVHRQHSQ